MENVTRILLFGYMKCLLVTDSLRKAEGLYSRLYIVLTDILCVFFAGGGDIILCSCFPSTLIRNYFDELEIKQQRQRQAIITIPFIINESICTLL